MELKRLIGEIHRRSLWQVLAIYLGASWLVLQVAQHVVTQFRLPEWTYGAALLLLLLGLPIVLATAFVQEGPLRPDGAGEEVADGARRVASRPPAPGAPSARAVFTWRNALLGAVGASALWGVVAAGWLLVAPTRGEEAGTRAQITALDHEGTWEGEEEAIPEEVRGGEDAPAEATGGAEGEGAVDPSRPAGAAGSAEPGAEGDAERPPPAAERRAAAPRGRPAVASPNVEPERTEYAALLEAATLAGSRARRAGAEERGLELGTADSLVAVARGAVDGGDLSRAERDLDSARALYEDAARRAQAGWRRAADSAAGVVAAARARARPSAPGYEEAEGRRGEAAAAAASGDFRLALARYREAEAGYARAAEAPATGPGAADEGAPDEAEAREAVTAALSRLERALQDEDLSALRAVWITMDRESARSFEAFFDRIRDFDVEIRVRWETLIVSASRMAVTGVTTWTYYDEGRRERASRPPFEQRFELAPGEDGWVVVSY